MDTERCRRAAQLAVSNPDSQASLANVTGMPAATAQRSATELLAVLASAADGDHSYLPPARPTEQQKMRLTVMQAEVAKIATDLGITAELIAPKKELSAIMLGEQDSRVFTGWRRAVVGQRLLEML